MGQDLESREDSQHLTAPTLPQILHIRIAMSCIFLEQNDTMLKKFRLFMVKTPPYLILQECTAILATDRCTN